jgi:hypothetical protein
LAWLLMVSTSLICRMKRSIMRLSSSLVKKSSVPRLAEAVVKLSNGATVSRMKNETAVLQRHHTLCVVSRQ